MYYEILGFIKQSLNYFFFVLTSVNHPCHSDTNCPPCAVLTEKLCMGGHEVGSYALLNNYVLTNVVYET